MLSKQERKLLAKKALQEQREEFQVFHFFSHLDLSQDQWIRLLKKELKNFNVNLDFCIIDKQTIRIYVPDIDIESSCFLRIGDSVEEIVTNFEAYDGASSDGMLESLTEKFFVSLSAQRKMNDVINLVFNTSTRIIGRISKGILVDVEQEYIGSDWLAWSCDYYESDLFKAFNYESLPEKYPCLVAKKWWNIF